MPSPDEIFLHWKDAPSNSITVAIRETFHLPENDGYIYRAESFAMTLSQIQEMLDTNDMKYQYFSHGEVVQIPVADITAYTSLYSSTVSTPKVLKSFASNAKKGSPREKVAQYLLSQRLAPLSPTIPRYKNHINLYYEVWKRTCEMTSFVGPLPDPGYADPQAAKTTHPILPVLYHHFGCACPSYEALWVISNLAREKGVLDIGSGNGYWSYMLRLMGANTVAVDNTSSTYRYTWIQDTVQADGVEYLKKHAGGNGEALLLVYPVTAGRFTERVLKAYNGDLIIIVGTLNKNRYTGFPDCTVEEYFLAEMKNWELIWRIPLPSFAGKDDGMLVWRKN